jgi:hypothetical protein
MPIPVLKLILSPRSTRRRAGPEVHRTAKAVLAQRSLLGKFTSNGIELDPATTFGLRIFLKEK